MCTNTQIYKYIQTCIRIHPARADRDPATYIHVWAYALANVHTYMNNMKRAPGAQTCLVTPYKCFDGPVTHLDVTLRVEHRVL